MKSFVLVILHLHRLAQNPLVRDYLSTLNASKSTLGQVVLVCESTLYQSSALI